MNSEPNITVENFLKCIKDGHNYGNEPTCSRCGHYGPGDFQHKLQQDNREMQTLICEYISNIKKMNEEIRIYRFFVIFLYVLILMNVFR